MKYEYLTFYNEEGSCYNTRCILTEQVASSSINVNKIINIDSMIRISITRIVRESPPERGYLVITIMIT